MWIEYGEAALITAFILCFMPIFLPLVYRSQGTVIRLRMIQLCCLFNWGLVTIAFVTLLIAFTTSNLTLSTVVMNSQASESLFYRLTATWGNHEGSLLLWVWILSMYQGVFALSGQTIPVRFRTTCLVLLSLIQGAFLVLILWTSNPFERLPQVAPQGLGLNPILQDPALAIHPPTLYLGYVGLVIPFVFAVVALWEKKWDAEWARWVQPWALFSWLFLTLGITLGSWWAYYEFGWGGWWFWDPVENASLFPWFLSVALLHSLKVIQKKEVAQAWTILLAILIFGLSILGAYLVRSGALPSVHGFAKDPQRGLFILSLLALLMGPSLILFLLRFKYFPKHPPSPHWSRTGAIAIQNYGMMLLTISLLIGTLYPLFVGEVVSVGSLYFNITMIPLSLPFLFLMGLAPALNWQGGDFFNLMRKFHWQLMLCLLLFLIFLYYIPSSKLLPLSVFILGAWVFSTTVVTYVKKIRLGKGHGMCLAHLGLAIALLGMSIDVLFEKEKVVALAVGEQVAMNAYHFELKSIDRLKNDVYMAEKGVVHVLKDHHLNSILYPEKRFYITQQALTTEVALYHHGLSQYYIVLGGLKPDGRRILRVYYHPFVSLIWLGGLLMVCGGLYNWLKYLRVLTDLNGVKALMLRLKWH
jgi:cytochrome c-type biogenesis protein CcmF